MGGHSRWYFCLRMQHPYLRYPCLPQKRGHNQKSLLHPCLLGCPQVGGIATLPLCSWMCPEKGTKREAAAEPLPLQSRFIGHGKTKGGGAQTFNHWWPPCAHIYPHRVQNTHKRNVSFAECA